MEQLILLYSRHFLLTAIHKILMHDYLLSHICIDDHIHLLIMTMTIKHFFFIIHMLTNKSQVVIDQM